MFIEQNPQKDFLAPEEQNVADLAYSTPRNIALLWSASVGLTEVL